MKKSVQVSNGYTPFWPTHRTPTNHPHLLTHSSKSHLWSLISKIYHIFGEIYRVLHFPLLELCQSPSLAGLLTFTLAPRLVVTESNYPKPHLTFLVILRLGLNSCDAGTICLQFVFVSSTGRNHVQMATFSFNCVPMCTDHVYLP